jgi:hypothetical protein
MGLGRYVVTGRLHVPAGDGPLPRSLDPRAVLVGRDVLVPLTDASITYDCASMAVTEEHETLLVNRARALWIEVVEEIDEGGDGAEATEDAAGSRTNYIKDFTGSVAD